MAGLIASLLLGGVSTWAAVVSTPHLRARPLCRSRTLLLASSSGARGDEPASGDEPAGGDELAAGPAPEAWREFRAQLISGGIKLTTASAEGEDADGTTPRKSAQPAPRVAVAPRNEELLRTQNEALYAEYVNGVWAHVSPPEPGGLLCRLPLQAQIMHYMRDERAVGKGVVWGERMREKLRAELPKASDGTARPELYAEWLANTAYCYRLVEGSVLATMRDMQRRTRARGPLTSSSMKEEELVLLQLFSAAQETWQEVCLVTAMRGPDRAEGVVLNRPLAKAVDRQLAKVLLGAEKPGAPTPDDAQLSRLVAAFGAHAGVYFGGPDGQLEPGLFVHGIDDLPGAVEVSPGTRIYTGGLEAAVDGILMGKYKPLDFRFFVGRHSDLSTAQGEYVALACARPVALKQCLGLPKPLWHEVMEMAGGECARLSRLEITKREDLQDDE